MKKLICTLLIFAALSASFTSCKNDDHIDDTDPSGSPTNDITYNNEKVDHIENTDQSELPTNEATNNDEASEIVDVNRELDPVTNMIYKLNDDGKSYSVYAGEFPEGIKELVIPGEYKGLPVTKAYGAPQETSIETIIISEGIREIDAGFADCFDIKNIYIPASVTYIEEGAFNSRHTMGNLPHFVKNNVIEKIVVAEGNPYYHVDGNCLIETQSKKLILGCNSSVIPVNGSVESIGYAAFANCKSMETIVIPRSVREIEYAAFTNCPALKQVYITASVSKYNQVVNFDPEGVFGQAPLDIIYVPDAESLEMYSELFEEAYFNIGTPHILSDGEVRQSAWEHWGIEPNSKDPDTGFLLSVFVEYCDDFYFADLKWLVEDQHYSQLDRIVIDAYTGAMIELIAK